MDRHNHPEGSGGRYYVEAREGQARWDRAYERPGFNGDRYYSGQYEQLQYDDYQARYRGDHWDDRRAHHQNSYRDQHRDYHEDVYDHYDDYDQNSHREQHRDYRDNAYDHYHREREDDYYGQEYEQAAEEAPQQKRVRALQLRLVKLTSDVMPAEQVVAIVDGRGDGVSIGRDRSFTARIRCPSMEISKHHANIFKNDDVFAVADTGSTHGTFLLLDPPPDLTVDTLPPVTAYQRLSAPKKASVPEPLRHMSLLRVGQTVFQIHLHEGRGSCQDCALSEDGLNEIPLLVKEKKETSSEKPMEAAKMMQQSRVAEPKVTPKQAIKQLKNRHLGEDPSAAQQGEAEATQYVDRAAARRARVGVQPVVAAAPPSSVNSTAAAPRVAPTVASSDPAAKLDESNRGYKMFASMSSKWGENTLSGQDPIFARGVEGRAGLGSKRLLDVQEMASRSYDGGPEGFRERQRRRFDEAR